MQETAERGLCSPLVRRRPGLAFALGMMIPGLFLLFALWRVGVWPFGQNIILEVDCLHQYLPFFTELRRKLVGGESLLYSFSGGLGYDFLATIAYYAASPLNLPMVLLPEAAVCDFMVWLIAFKLCLCGGIFAWYLYRRGQGSVLCAAAFGTMYALSNYFLGYKFNIMWLDSAAVLPLVMDGIEQMADGRGSAIYLCSLFYAIWCNFYIGFMVCVFACLYLVLQLSVREGMTAPAARRCVLRFLVNSLLAGGMGAVLLVPAYLSLGASSSGLSEAGPGISLYAGPLSLLRAHFADSAAFRTSQNRGDVHLYCGVAALLLPALFFANGGLRRRLRLGYAALLAFLLLSFVFSPLNYLWHGFHLQTALPNRFSFVYIALLLKVSHLSLGALSGLSRRRCAAAACAVPAAAAALAVWEAAAGKGAALLISVALLALYALLILAVRSGRPFARIAYVLLCCLLIFEAGGHAEYDLLTDGAYSKTYCVDYQADFQSLMARQEQGEFSRSEIDSTYMANFITYAGGSGVAQFNSTMQHDVRILLGELGMRERMNAVSYRGASKLLNDLLGVRYVVTNFTSSDTWNGMTKIDQEGGKSLYRNDNALSLGFAVNPEIALWDPHGKDPLTVQNEFVRLACGEEDLYRRQMRFFARPETGYLFDIPEDGMLFVSLDHAPQSMAWRTPEYERTYDSKTDFLLCASAVGAGEKARLEFTTAREELKGTSYTCSGEDYRRVIGKLSAEQMENAEADGNRISGSVDVQRERMLLLTVPYSEGWTAFVDGEAREIHRIGGALMGIMLDPGRHRIEMRYVPQGLYAGLAVSLCCLPAAAAVQVIERKRKRRMDAPA